MIDLPHSAIEAQFRPPYKVVEERAVDPRLAWFSSLTEPAELAALASAENQIEDLANLQQDWDGYGALPVNSATRYNSLISLRALLLSAPSPEITPNPNGTISFEWESPRGAAHLEIGQSGMSFYIKREAGNPILANAKASDILISAIQWGSLISTNLFPLRHRTSSLTTIRLAGDVSPSF